MLKADGQFARCPVPGARPLMKPLLWPCLRNKLGYLNSWHLHLVCNNFSSELQLDTSKPTLYIGGVEDISEILTHPGRPVQAYDFVGCIRDFFINGKEQKLENAVQSSGVSSQCPRKSSSSCAQGLCKNGGRCIDEWFDYICECPNGFSGRNCDEGKKYRWL